MSSSSRLRCIFAFFPLTIMYYVKYYIKTIQPKSILEDDKLGLAARRFLLILETEVVSVSH